MPCGVPSELQFLPRGGQNPPRGPLRQRGGFSGARSRRLGRSKLNLSGGLSTFGVSRAAHFGVYFLAPRNTCWRGLIFVAGRRLGMASIWTEGKTPSTLDPFTAPESDACILNQRVDNLTLVHRRLTHTSFVGVGLKGATVNEVDFSHSTFVRCYFRGTHFRACNFTGCRFIECDFPSVTLINCNFAYSEWKETLIDPARSPPADLPRRVVLAERPEFRLDGARCPSPCRRTT
jgi:hypothetical protein